MSELQKCRLLISEMNQANGLGSTTTSGVTWVSFLCNFLSQNPSMERGKGTQSLVSYEFPL